ncbi:MAG TPA: ABC transporter ATP-binding protein [Dehalococcoidia bacterium]|jgi:Fe-S cluster assembly ATP-binding protein|nr:ABC transporter ATP-binding protein [Dehalococcoidia bacterium]
MLEVENLQYGLNGKSIINNLSLHVDKGEIHGILGENGTGKTTLAYLIMGVNNCEPTGGRVVFEDQDIADLSVSQRAKKGITLAWQEPARIEGLRVRDYLKLSGNNLGIEQVENCLWMVGLEPAQYLDRDVDDTLSGGERKRIELASVLAMRPKLAILDEPDSGIDIISLPLILNGIVEMSKRGSSVLLITHNEKVAEIAHRVSLLCAGKIIRTGEPAGTSQWFKEHCRTCPHINEPTEWDKGL